MRFTHNNNIVRGLVGGDNNIFVMKERQVFKTVGSLKIDVERVRIESLSFVILIWISDLRKCHQVEESEDLPNITVIKQ
jgi:hypothetical protein